MNPISWWRWWRALPHNPVYQRERGGWGKPNQFYDNLSRFSPFVVLGAIVFGLCAGSANPALLAGNDALLAFYCFLCLPGILLNGLTMFGMLMAPALTAPTISMELNRGTWDILRATPLSTRSIVLAKLFGALGRLRIWPILFALSLLQGLLLTCSLTFAGTSANENGLAIWGAAVGVTAVIRPFLEILFAGFMGMYISTRLHSSTTALAGSYTAVVLMRVFNSSLLWLAVSTLLELDEGSYIVSYVGPTIIYALTIVALLLGLLRQADKLSQS